MTYKNKYNSKTPERKADTSQKKPALPLKYTLKYNFDSPKKRDKFEEENEQLSKFREYTNAVVTFQEEESSLDETHQTRISTQSTPYQIQKSSGDTDSGQNEGTAFIKFQLIAVKEKAAFEDEEDRNVKEGGYVNTADWPIERSFFEKSFEDQEEVNSVQGFMKETSLLAVSTVDETGWTLQISDTDVKLEIPKDALQGEHEIQIRIVPNCLLVDEYRQSFCSNSSVVVDILPSDLRLKHPAKLTLPHCLVLSRDEECTADLYSCSHREDTRPLWRKVSDVSVVVEDEWCVIPLTCFSRKALKIFSWRAISKKIVVYAARRKGSTDEETGIEIGWYRNLKGEEKALRKEKHVLEERPFLLTREGEMPVRVSYVVAKSSPWISMEEENTKNIPYSYIKESMEYSCTFVLRKNRAVSGVSCRFTVTQDLDSTNMIDLTLFIENPSTSQAGGHSGGSRGESRIEADQNSDFPPTASSQSDCVVNLEILRRLSREISNEWTEIGRELGLEDSKLGNIKANFPGDQKEQVYQMFLTWHQENGKNATYRVLREALIAAGRKDLADKSVEINGKPEATDRQGFTANRREYAWP